ncbi:RNA polymerase sigma-54 factor RpoN [hydrothermal vent metagenome]|uniref:RNA polymerase sigma-54 factor RpoN n=1 Tax=hydrothermal vent metagenome TaxID=652676 RepID=A0A3B1AZ42_9ZZZZ
MKQTLQLRLGQHLTMTPQLQQAIRLLQLSSLELQTEIQEILDSNVMLESSEDSDSYVSQETEKNQNSNDKSETNLDLQDTSIPNDLPTDSNWEDTFDNLPTSPATHNSDYNSQAYETANDRSESLHETLNWQLNLTSFSDTDSLIATHIIDSINDDGYLSLSVKEIHANINKDNDLDEIELDEIEAVLHLIQTFEPAGVAARDLQENLAIQLANKNSDDSLDKLAVTLINEHFDLLANRDYPQLMRRMKLSEENLAAVIDIITSLNPRPGSQITDQKPEYVIPDVSVKKINGVWKVKLNKDNTPSLRINSQYADLIKNIKNNSDNNTLKDHLQEAKWFIKSLSSRNDTLLKVANSIVKHQRAFLDYGDEAMKALVLHDIAEEVEMHESTISRVTTKKYMHTPRGIFELKYFFSSHVSTTNGGECSATAIRALIKKLVLSENRKKPLSDNKLAEILSEQGIKIARRTIAKYREALAIPPSNERKRLQ